MEKQKVDITNTSPRLAAILLIFIAMNTCVSMVQQELTHQTQQDLSFLLSEFISL